ncbi:hypothetical protein RRG08_019168 [Elysia crispata]|uniref:Uncharacterized protein n=1 Tax=Elysia crispata TaxID=231223 RepID=A0AAE0YEN9_9GAST|nr:hypothetical protein RRG08_019168 [Elysia crispata]
MVSRQRLMLREEMLDMLIQEGSDDEGFLDDVVLSDSDEGSDGERCESRTRNSIDHSLSASADVSDLGLNLDNEENIDEADYMYEWTKNLDNFPMVPPFTGESGLQFDTAEKSITTPLGLLSCFINIETVKSFKCETNMCPGYHICKRKEWHIEVIDLQNLEHSHN